MVKYFGDRCICSAVEPHASLLLVVCAEQQHKLLEVAAFLLNASWSSFLVSPVFLSTARPTLKNKAEIRHRRMSFDSASSSLLRISSAMESIRHFVSLKPPARVACTARISAPAVSEPSLHVETHVANQVQIDHSHLHRTVVDARRPHYLSREIDVERSRFQVEFFRLVEMETSPLSQHIKINAFTLNGCTKEMSACSPPTAERRPISRPWR